MMLHHSAAFRAAPPDLRPVIATLALRMGLGMPPAPLAITFKPTRNEFEGACGPRQARIAQTDCALLVSHNGYEWRRLDGQWQMLGRSGDWFPCEIQDPAIRRQVDDFESCLRSYTFDEGPPPPVKRRGETIQDCIRRLQLAELRAGTKNIFAPVNTKYTPCEDHRRELAARLRARGGPIDKRDPWVKYDEAMRLKRYAEAVAKIEAEPVKAKPKKTRTAKFPGWRNMTAAQRYNARKDAIFDEAKRLGALG